MSIGLIVFICLLSYVAGSVIVGSHLIAHNNIKNKKINRNEFSEDQMAGTFFGTLFWPGGLVFLIMSWLSAKLSKIEPDKKCILCGTKNPNNASHCIHCGNLIDGAI